MSHTLSRLLFSPGVNDEVKTTDQPDPSRAGRHLVLYDGVCGLCNGFVRFVLRRDARARFVFAPLQSELASRLLEPHGIGTEVISSMFVIADHGTENERVWSKARAALFVCRELGWPWRAAAVLRVLPTFVLDLGYDLVARCRYLAFGKLDTCPVPPPEHRARFLG